MGELKREQVQTPAPQISVDNTQQDYVQSPTKTHYECDVRTWSDTDPLCMELLRQAHEIKIERSGGFSMLRSVYYAYADHANDRTGLAWPGVKRIAALLNTDRTTVKRCRLKLYPVGLIANTGQRDPRYGSHIHSFPAYEKAMRGDGLGDGLGDGYSHHKQNITKTKTHDVNNDYETAMSELASELRPDYSNKVRTLFTATMKLRPEWQSNPKDYYKALCRVLEPGIRQPGGVVIAMEQLLEQEQNIRPQVREPVKVQSEPVPPDRPYEVCQPIYEALMQQLEPQQRLDVKSPLALMQIEKIIKARPEWANDITEFAAQLKAITNKQGTLKDLETLAGSLS